jgi:DNA repair exonuclease SbcCD nuclease subunit
MVTFIHAADIHLDSPLKGLERYEGAPVDEIRGATRRALENLVDLALERRVEFVVIAGDVYDGDWKDHNTGLFFVAQMSRLREADTPVVLIHGNHDAASRMTRQLRLPDNVEVLSHKQAGTSRSKRLRELGVAVHGKSFAQAAEHGNLARDYPPPDRGLLNIGLLHTSLTGAEGHEPYAPCTLDDLRQKEYDYWALGHVHNAEVKCDDPHVVFCGNLQGRHIREPGAKGCYVVTLDDGRAPQMEFHALDVFRWELCHVDASELRHPDDVLDRFGGELTRLLERHAGLPLAVRVIVSGRTPVHSRLCAQLQQWKHDLRAVALSKSGGSVWVEQVRPQTTSPRSADPADGADGPITELFRCMDELRRDDTLQTELARELNELCRKLPPELLCGEEALALDDPDYLGVLLEEAQPLLISRLLEE